MIAFIMNNYYSPMVRSATVLLFLFSLRKVTTEAIHLTILRPCEP